MIIFLKILLMICFVLVFNLNWIFRFLDYLVDRKVKSQSQSQITDIRSRSFYKFYNDTAFALVCDLEKHFFDNTIPINFFTKDYFKSFGIELSNNFTLNDLYDKLGLGDFSTYPESSWEFHSRQHIRDLSVFTLSNRHEAATTEVMDVMSAEEVEDKYGLNLYNDELLIKVFPHMCWKEERTKTTGVSYSGVRFQGRGAFKAAFGTMSTITHKSTSYQTVDDGELYLTNKRVIFIGEKNKNRSLRLNKILNIDLYQDGVLLGKENGTSPLLFWPDWEQTSEHLRWSQWKRREAGEFSILLNRVMFEDIKYRVKELA